MNIEEALLVLDTALEQKFLNDIQELVFRQSWLGQTYLEMAETSGYNANYIKDVGYKLWKLLSKVFQEEVRKSNFRSVLRRQYINFKNATQASIDGVTNTQETYTSTLHSVFEAKFTSHTQNVDASVNQKQDEGLVGDVNISNSIQSKQIATPQIVINTVVAAPLDIQKIKQNKKIENNVLTVIPQADNTQAATAKNYQSLKQAVNLLTSYESGTEINLLKQWIRDDRYCLVAVLAGREVISH